MEEVWKDLSLSSLHQEDNNMLANSADFFAKYCHTNPPPKHSQPEPQPAEEFDRSNAERRKNRMMKNRESATRSRARKQAYTNELEKEVDKLHAENTMLRRQNEELKKSLEDQIRGVTKQILQRTLTAPF
ncbi:bZIP transcription factor 27-like [Zingiber officinale]|uniref:bZIP transcription factor 27-like n=1 Tax=Zingiber officinale TaxID=94328 RepID=UPI001C4B4A82|nr:bZIP transcription factor 27-like [Zingiber officinale]